MNIAFGISHPLHMYVWKGIIKRLENHHIFVIAESKKCVLELLRHYGIEHIVIGPHHKNIAMKILGMMRKTILLREFLIKTDIDLGIWVYNVPIAIASKLCGSKSLIFYNDNEHRWRGDKPEEFICNKFANFIAIPIGDGKLMDKATFTFGGVLPLAYLHPNYFKPKKEILEKYELEEPFIVLREREFAAVHDIKLDEVIDIEKYIKELEKYGDIVFVLGRGGNRKGVKNVECSPDIHHLLYFASLFVGDSATMCEESAILGTPTLKVSKLKKCTDDQLINKGILEYYDSREIALKRAKELLENNEKEEWRKRAKRYCEECGDVQTQILDGIEDIIKKIE